MVIWNETSVYSPIRRTGEARDRHNHCTTEASGVQIDLHTHYLVDTPTPFALTSAKSDFVLTECGPDTILLSNADLKPNLYHLPVINVKCYNVFGRQTEEKVVKKMSTEEEESTPKLACDL